MAFLFQIEGSLVYPNTETLLISPYKDIWERDKTKKKEVALQEFAYIEFCASMKKSNPYRQYPENIKEQKVQEAVIHIDKWKPDKLVKQAMEDLKEFQLKASTTYSYYMSAKIAAEKMDEFYRNVDLSERNPKTFSPIYKPKEVTSALMDTERVMAALKNLEKKVEEELYEESRNKANKDISPFAKVSSLNSI